MIFDAVILAAVILSSIIAFLRGFVREVLTIFGVVGGLAASYFGGPILVPLMRGWLGVKELAKDEKPEELFGMIPMTIVADVCAYGLIFIVVVIILSVLSHFLATGVKAIGLGPVDRILGVLFGVGRAILLMALIYLPVYLLTQEKDRDEWFKGSRTRVYVEGTAAWINGFLPKTEDGQDDKDKKAEKDASAAGDALNKKMDALGQRLEDMEVLKNTADKAGAVMDSAKDALQGQQGATGDAPSDVEGYKQDQRESLDQLIETTQPE
jgi:membrane protein required for colicin V production